MIQQHSLDDIYTGLDSHSETEISAHLWIVTKDMYKYSSPDRAKIVSIIGKLADKHIRSYEVYSWLNHFLNHGTRWLTPQQRDVSVSIFSNTLRGGNLVLIKTALESMARQNYLMSESQLNTVVHELVDFSAILTDEAFYEDLLICCSSLYYYAPEPLKPKLKAIIDKFQARTGIYHYFNEYPQPPEDERADIVFFIPEYLSGKSFIQPPTGVLTSAAVLKDSGFRVKVIDNRVYHLNSERVIQVLNGLQPKSVVVVTTPYDQVSIYYTDYRWGIIKNTISFLKGNQFSVVLCGSHGTLKPDYVHKVTGADGIVKGEWDLTLNRLFESLSKKQWDWSQLDEVPNIAYFNGERLVHTVFNHGLFYPLAEQLPIPDYELVDMQAYYGDEYKDNVSYTKFPWGSILAQRGCPFKCEFCYLFFGNKIRRRTTDQVVEEMEILQNEHGISHIFFIDYTFTTNKKWVAELCRKIIDRGLTVKWNCETRADCLDPEVLKLMKQANCHRIWIGVETFSDKLLEDCTKEIDETEILTAIRDIYDAGIKVSCFLMLGLPSESPESINYTLKRIQETGVEYTKSIITFIPRYGTDLFERASGQIHDESFEAMYSIRGLVDNEITEAELVSTVQLMKKRDSDAWKIGDEAADAEKTKLVSDIRQMKQKHVDAWKLDETIAN